MPTRLTSPPDSWTAAVHPGPDDCRILGTGVVIAEHRVLTSAHILRTAQGRRNRVWVAFPKAGVPYQERREAHCRFIGDPRDLDLAVLELVHPAPAAALPARIRCVPADELRNLDWWTFGFPASHQGAGNEAHGRVGATLSYGTVQLEVHPASLLDQGFSGSGVWASEYAAVVGLVTAAAAVGRGQGNGFALTLDWIDHELPDLELRRIGRWRAEAADDRALAAWGWRRRPDPALGRHWSPRSQGVLSSEEPGCGFHGRRRALTDLLEWLNALPDGRLLVVTGSPGVGKSALLGRIVTTSDPELSAQLPAQDDALRAPLGSVTCAVHASGKTATEVAAEIARAASVAIPASAEELVPVLRRRLRLQPGRFTLILDALDEMASPDQPRLIQQVLPLLVEPGPGAAQVVVATRRADQQGDLLEAFADSAVVMDLDRHPYMAEADLVAYATAVLQRWGADRADHPYRPAAAAAPVAQRIAACSGGNFLIAGLIARGHARDDTEPVDPADVSFSPTVDAALESYLAGLAPVGTSSARLALTVLAYAESPGIPLPMWHAGIAALGGDAEELQLAEFAHGPAANFLVGTDSGPSVRGYRLFHQALADALRRARETSGVSNAADQASLLAVWLRQGRGTGWTTAYDYLLRRLPVHAEQAGAVDELLCDDSYLLHADLAAISRVTQAAGSGLSRRRARLLHRTPQAVTAEPMTRAALFSVSDLIDQLATGLPASRAPYQGRWAHTRPRGEHTSLEGHTTAVLAVSSVPGPEGDLLASAGADGTIRLWDPATGQPKRVLDGHTDQVYALCALPGCLGYSLASAGADHTVRVWDVVRGEPGPVMAGHTDWVRGLCAITVAERPLLASASDDHTVRLWDPMSGDQLGKLPHPGWVTAVCPVTVAGTTLLATAGLDLPVTLWDPGTGERVGEFAAPPYWLTSLAAVSVAERELLAGAGYGNGLWLWDPGNGQPGQLAAAIDAPVAALATLPPGGRSQLAAAGEDRLVRLWDPATGRLGPVLAGHTDQVRGVCAVKAGGRSLLASAGDDGTVRLWDPSTGAAERVLDGAGLVARLALSTAAHPRVVAAAGGDGDVHLFDLVTGRPGRRLAAGPAAATSICPLPASVTSFAVGTDHGAVQLWEPESGSIRMLSAGRPGAPITGVAAVAGPAGYLVAAASDDEWVRLWRLETRNLELVLHHLCRVTAICAVPTSGGEQLLATADEDGVVRLWDPASGERLHSLRGHHAAATALCSVTTGGRQLLASASEDRGILVWDPETGDRVATLPGHSGRVTDLCPVQIGEGDQLLASTSEDRTVRLWEPASGACRHQIPVYHPALACRYTDGILVLGLTAGILAIDLRPTLL
ncbi:trypsin-like peptidase domain-containing protein [Natronosporangium hydrolyticum]|uniref:Trypsin-like peptidase domain-containing protein n=1 Tax=Natronosporangium hydrolyticum TaxID=2811111 RepID=A0A895Y6R4_9ACTN|nr:trypsin-like peptidase domain-containing protein [Natronosporangium hydrolyticum]QSB13061.1 trypsin-like peptidase domain-containing protein [Natronosporangium hydrolyticum]